MQTAYFTTHADDAMLLIDIAVESGASEISESAPNDDGYVRVEFAARNKRAALNILERMAGAMMVLHRKRYGSTALDALEDPTTA